ncbi:MAG: TraE/TraK family type IV conjugative transfer system protein [Sideroxyarcus sp.]|nr:TraE/TraK family type IV conjugative transfer system protein [Sideroxyarcus sp.]
MTPQHIASSHKKKAGEISFLRLVVGGLLVLCIVEGLLISRTLGMEKTIVTPPTIEKSFWVSADGVSKSYLEQMAYWYAGLALTATRTTGEYQKKLFLKYASPQKSGQLAAEMASRLEFMEKNSASTLFTARSVNADEKLMRVAIYGDIETFVQDKRISIKPVVYVIAFQNINGRIFVNEFKETNEKDIFGIGATPQ